MLLTPVELGGSGSDGTISISMVVFNYVYFDFSMITFTTSVYVFKDYFQGQFFLAVIFFQETSVSLTNIPLNFLGVSFVYSLCLCISVLSLAQEQQIYECSC